MFSKLKKKLKENSKCIEMNKRYEERKKEVGEIEIEVKEEMKTVSGIVMIVGEF